MSYCNPCFGSGPAGPDTVIVQWGNIRGSLTSQVDLWNFLGTKANISSLSAVAFSGDYLDLKNKPNIGAQLTLQQVTDNGNTTTDNISIGGLTVNGTGSFSGLVSGIPGVNPSDFATVSQLSSAVSPGGNYGDLQFNNGGIFGGSDQLVWSSGSTSLLLGTAIDNITARLQILDSTGQNQLALHFDANNYVGFSVDSVGDLTIEPVSGGVLISSYLYCNNSVYVGPGTFLAWGSPSSFATILDGNTDGTLRLFDSTFSNFNFLQFGGQTSSYPAIHISGTTLEIKLADNSAYSNLSLSKLLIQSSSLGSIVNGTLETDFTNLYFSLGGVRKTVSFGSSFTLSTTGTTGASTLINGNLNIPVYQGQLTLTTTGTTGISTLIGNTLNIPDYGAASGYTLPPATTSTLGGVIVGANIQVTNNGTISLQSSGVTGALGYTPLDPSGNSSQYFAGNGQLIIFPTIYSPGGSNTDIQFNNSGVFGGTGALTWSGLLFFVSGSTQITSLSSTGTTMVVASSTGLLSIQPIPTSALPGGSNTDIQFNNSGFFAGSNNLTWNGSLFFVSGNTQIGSLASTGITMVVATSTGLLQTQAIPVSAISSISNIDGSLTISPTTGAVIASLNPAHSNIWTAVQTFQDNGLGAVTSSGISLVNTSLATSGVTQVSPAIYFQGSGWKTNATATSESVIVRQYLSPISFTTSAIANIAFDVSINGAAFANLLNIEYSLLNLAFPSTLINTTNANGLEINAPLVYLSNGSGPHVECLTANVTSFPQAMIRIAGPTGGASIATGANPVGTRLQIGASSSTLSHINLVSGATKTVSADGDIWYSSHNLMMNQNGTVEQIIAGAGGGSAPSTVAFATPSTVYGSSSTTVLGIPADWLVVNVNGTLRRIPLY